MKPTGEKELLENLLAFHAALTEFGVKLAVLTTVLIHRKLITEAELLQCEKEIRRPLEMMAKPMTAEQVAAAEREFPGFSEMQKHIQGGQ